MKYALYIDNNDYRTCDYKVMTATTLEEAIAEADAIFNHENHYLARIMKKEGKTVKHEDGFKREVYTAVLCRRSYGWHLNNQENGEGEHKAVRVIAKTWDDFQTI